MIDPATNTSSYITNGATTIAPVNWLQWAWAVYHPHAGSSRSRFPVAPQLYDPDLLVPAHPRTIVVTSTADPLRDEGASLAKALKSAGLLAAHIEAKGSHVFGPALDREARARVLSAWAAMIL